MMRLQMMIFLVFLTFLGKGQQIQTFEEQAIFTNGADGYTCYRIPAIIKVNNGDLLAFAEGRVGGCNDFGDVDIVLKTSSDDGSSWSPLQVVVNNGDLQAGNPAPVLDRFDPMYEDGRIFLFYNQGTASEHDTRMGNGLRTIHYMTSSDHGRTWSSSTDITTHVHKPNRPDIDPKYNHTEDWRSYALTPGHALQLEHERYKGRIFVPANHSYGPPQDGFNDYRAHAFYTDDHGKTWSLSPSIEVPSSNESIAIERTDGSIMQNIRQQNGESRKRLVAISNDGGDSWSETYFDGTLITPVCQASIISYTLPNGSTAILFSNPESTTKRENLTIKMSIDDGHTWPVSRSIRAGESAYSDLVIQSDSDIGVLYEHGNDGGIHYAHFNLSWLVGDQNHSELPWLQELLSSRYSQSLEFQLAKPKTIYHSTLFSEVASLDLAMDYPGSTIYYTIDGSTPTIHATPFDEEILITSSTVIKAIASHPDLRQSEVVSVEFVKATKVSDIKSITLSREPSPSYPGGGSTSLFDLEKGDANFGSGRWMGYEGGVVQIDVIFDKPRPINHIKISALSNPGAWIMYPGQIEVRIGDTHYNKYLEVPTSAPSADQRYIDIPFTTITTDKISIHLSALDALPDWHQGKGNPAWMFIDEILID